MERKKCKNQTDLNEIWFSGVLGPGDLESKGQISKFKVADPIWKVKKCKNQTDLNEIWYSGVLGPGDLGSKGQISTF